MTAPVTSSIVRPPWNCPKCGQANANTTARCTNKRFDESNPRYLGVPPVPVSFGLHNFGEYLKELGLDGFDPPAVVWECSGRVPCPICGADARAYGHGPRCEAHAGVMAIMEAK